MPRSLENLFSKDEPEKAEGGQGPRQGAFDELLDEGPVDTKGAIDASWEKVGAEASARAKQAPVTEPEAEPALDAEDQDVDDLLGIGAPATPPRPAAQEAPQPAAAGEAQGGGFSIPWWVPIAAALLALAGAALVLLT
ncbi:MAG: hypothetical protein R3F30_06165 [Planctomycetota bacterium]